MSYSEDDLLPISALQHLLFCERQCALIHIERLWADNLFTAEGNVLHEKAHTGASETRDGVRISRGLPLQNFQLGLFGQADVIEWEPPRALRTDKANLAAVIRDATPAERLTWRVTPVEYKRGKPKENECDRVQLCAQAMCLEEMLSISISQGSLFYGEKRRRVEVIFDEKLRKTVVQSAARFHQIIAIGQTPIARREKKCETCSLLQLCLPAAGSQVESAKAYLNRMIQ